MGKAPVKQEEVLIDAIVCRRRRLVAVIFFAAACIRSEIPARRPATIQARAVQTQPTQTRKRALLVAIGRYYQLAARPGQRPWAVLHAQQETEEYRQVLIRSYGFADSDVRVLLDEQATAANIRAAFQQHLVQQTRPGDIALFHFSGHGQQLPDQSDPSTQDEEDGLDESLVPYDATDQSIAEGIAKNIRDDEVGVWLDSLAQRMTRNGSVEGHIAVTLDTCFSGSATRGSLVARGRPWDDLQDGARPLHQASLGVDGAVGVLRPEKLMNKNIVVVSAARADQSAWERNGRGVFTRHWLRLLASAQPDTLPTYRAALDRLAIDIAAEGEDQSPQVEGLADQLLFSALAKPLARPRGAVRALRTDSHSWQLQAGEVHGVTAGSRYQLYDAGASQLDETSLLGNAQVQEVRPFSAVLVSDTHLGTRNGALAIEKEHAYSVAPLRVELTGMDAVGEVKRALRSLDILRALEHRSDGNGEADLEVRYVAENQSVAVFRYTSSVAEQMFATTTSGQIQLERWLRAEWRRRQFIQLRNENPAARVDIELIPYDFNRSLPRYQRQESVPLLTPTPAAHITLSNGKAFAMRLRNRTSHALYVAVLGISPDGAIDLVFPRDSGAHRIEAGQTFEPNLLTGLGGVVGERVVLKVFATDAFVDFAGVSTAGYLDGTRSLSTVLPAGSSYRPLQLLLEKIGEGSRGPERGIEPSTWGTTEGSVLIAREL